MTKSLLAALFVLPLTACISDVGSGDAQTVMRDAEGATGFHLANFVGTTVRQADGPATLELTCDDNLLPLIETEVDDGVLVLRTANGHNLLPKAECRAEVSLPILNELVNSGSGGIEVEGNAPALHDIALTGSGGIQAEGALEDVRTLLNSGSGGMDLGGVAGCEIDVEHSGSGGIGIAGMDACELSITHSGSGATRLAGGTQVLDLRQSGSGGLSDEAFQADAATILISGSGGVELTVNESLDATLTGSGGLRVHGDPQQRDVTETGSGSVRFED